MEKDEFVLLWPKLAKFGGGSVARSCPALATPWTVAPQAPLSMGFSRQECWSGVPLPPPGDPPHPVTEPGSPALQTDPLSSEPPGKLIEHLWTGVIIMTG